jgi:hypothetical protein
MSNDHYFLLVAYLDNVKLHKCAIRLGTSTTRIATDCTEGGERRSVYPCQNPCCAYRWPNLTLSSYHCAEVYHVYAFVVNLN